MRSMVLAAFLTLSASAQAETWTCSPSGTPMSVLFRITLSPPNAIFQLQYYTLSPLF